MIRYLCLLALILHLLAGDIHARQFKELLPSDSLTAKFWTVRDGLPINTVNHVTQDDDGYLWFTTYDGIVRFDGIYFKTFNHSNTAEIPHNRATEIYKQDGVGIWVSMEHEGVLLIKESGFIHFGIEDGFSKSDVTQIYEDSEKRMFFVTHDGLFVFEDGKFSRFFKGKDELQDRIRWIFEDYDGSKWIATNNGLINVSENGIREYNASENQKYNIFYSVYRNSSGILLAGSSNGLFQLSEGELRSPERYSELKEADVYRIFEHNRITFLSSYRGLYKLVNGIPKKVNDLFRKKNEAYYIHHIDSDNLLWLIGDRGTLTVYRDGRLLEQGILRETGLNHFISIFEDREKNTWITTPREGIIRLRRAQVKTIGLKEGLSENNILGMLKDSKGRYWIGTRGGGLNLIEGNKVKHFIEHRDIASSIVQSIGEDSLGNIWIGHYQKGLNKISDKGFEEFKLGEKLDVNNVHALYTSKKGQLWIGTYGGLVKFDDENLNHIVFKKEDGLSGVKIRYITEANDQSLWIGSLDGGVSHFKDNTFTNYTKEKGLSSNNVRSIYIDEHADQTIWVGTENNGLNRIKKGQITYITKVDGLPDYNIHWISEDDLGWLWMSTNKGVLKILKSSLNDYLDGNVSSFTMLTFGRNEGMRNAEGNGSIQEAGLKNSDGSFWFATQEGVAIFNKEKELKRLVEPKTIINSVTAKGEVFQDSIIVFEAGINDFEVEVHAITYINPQLTRFRYKLEEVGSGFDGEWVETDYERIIKFVDVKPNRYRFTVQATNSDGFWLEKNASIFITIKPKYYQESWFVILCILLGGLIFTGGWRLRHKNLIRKQEKLEEIIEEQTQLIQKEKKEIESQKEIIEEQAKNLELSNKAKDKFFSIIAHDLRNPFQAMIGYSEYLYSSIEEVDEQELKESLGIIKDSSQTLLRLTENLLKWANLQTGNIKPEFSRFPINDIVNKNKMLFQQAAKQKEILLDVKIESEIILFADYNMIDTIIRNLISNAVKFTRKGGSVTLDATVSGKECEILISDTGIGMSKQMLHEVLSLGKNTSRKGTNEEKGSGLGLILCQEMIGLNNGTLAITSEENIGTRFVIKFPLSDEK